ncbi:MAG: FeoB-associated Cys-rich membrane protein [Verrucomicrobiaceae bacterium]|nr:FeoB-associated Cys-rich membrane protein [Verrucomicrobiaceae bacterium]
MNENWQSIAAIAVVLITVVLFAVRAARRRKKPGCGGSCGCGK